MEGWIAAFGEAEGVARSARATLRVWEAAGADSAAEEVVKVRRLLGKLQQVRHRSDRCVLTHCRRDSRWTTWRTICCRWRWTG